MKCANLYPLRCRKNIKRLVDLTGVSVETAYAMILMTATLMDLQPEDEDVLYMILEDIGIEEEKEDDIA